MLASKMIADLEGEWNIVLLERSRSGVQPTSDGLAMLPYARNLLNSYQKVQEQAASLSGITTGLIRIGTFSSVAAHWLPTIIQKFQKDYPGIRYEFLLGDYEEIEQWIFEGRVDCGFLRLPTKPEYETISLAVDEYVAVLPVGHPLTSKDMLCPQDINVELSRKVEPENTQNITAAIFADGVERSGTESANFGGYAASPRAASRNCSGGSPSGFDVYTLKRL